MLGVGYAYLNVGTLGLGIAAWSLAFFALVSRKENRVCAVGSWVVCAGSLYLVILYLGHLADIEDCSAFLDTMNAFRLCAGVLLAGTLLLNAAAALWSRGKEEVTK